MGKRWHGAGRTSLSVVLVIAVFISGFTLGSLRSAGNVAAAPQVLAQTPKISEETEALFAPFWETWDTLHRNYVDPLDDNALMEGAISGMMESIGDRHTNYYDPAMYKSINEEMGGQFGGIGASLKRDIKTGTLTIVSTIPGSPARQSGLLPGDVIAQVDGVDISTIPESRVISRVRGATGTKVTLGILRKGQPPILQITITRALIVIQTVTVLRFPDNIGYIKLQEFNSKATEEFTKALESLDANSLRGLVIDLRGNPGGYLSTVVDITSQFLSKGNVLLERSKSGRDRAYRVKGDPLAPDVPIVVLVNGGSASASELMAGALQDYKRALIVGEQTYGKGSVQIVDPLSNGGGAHLTIARWYTPLGRHIHGVGITPDVQFTWDTENYPDRDTQLEQALLILRGEF
jgi:carboxyl-terminal processing protease